MGPATTIGRRGIGGDGIRGAEHGSRRERSSVGLALVGAPAPSECVTALAAPICDVCSSPRKRPSPYAFISTRPSLIAPMRSSPPWDRPAAELTLLPVVDAEAATLCC